VLVLALVFLMIIILATDTSIIYLSIYSAQIFDFIFDFLLQRTDF
jgi:hypothetical protein